MGPDEMCLWVLQELVDDITKPVSIKSDKACQCLKGPADWKRLNIPPIEKEDMGNYKAVSLISVPGKVMKHILLETMLRHMENHEITGDSQHDFTEDKS